ncbi:MAG TPA: YceI family protein [Solirubrobacteraceae bacterium]|jgi:polyisoprenoid-binding protein YceI|nr:YceI family protein [Solirubrobacteraceae bacterium]
MSATSAAVDSMPETGMWSIDSAHSTVSFKVRHHAVATFRSSFTNVSGAYDGAERQLTGEVQVSDITLTGLDRLKGHILTPDFFNAEEFPAFSFQTTAIEQDGEKLTVEGELTLRGVTKPITATGSVRGPQMTRHGDGHVSQRLGIDLATTIDRREWGVNFNNEVSEGVINLGWDVEIEAALELYINAED